MLEQRFSLELTKNGVQKSVYARQGENNARTLSIALTIAGKVANISGYNIRAYYDDNTYSTITNNGNPIEVEIPGTLCANAGERVCELKLFKDDDATDTITEVCYSPQFAVIVEGTIGAEAESVPAGQAVQYEPLLGTSTVSQSAISSTDQFVVYGSDGTTNKTLRKSATDVADAISKKHSHANKALLDTYTQTEADIADSVTKKHNHSNKSFLDGLNDTYFDGRYYTESETDTKLSSKQNTLTAGANITIVNDVISATGGEVVIVHLTEDAQGNISCTDATITEIKGYYDAGKLVYCQDVNGIRLPLVMATSTAVSFAFGGADGSHDDVINGLTYIGVVSGESDTWFFTEATLDGKMTEIYNSSTSKSKYTPSELKDMMESHTGMQYNGISILKSEMLNSKFYFYLLDNYNIEKYEVDASKNVSRVTQRILVDDNELSGAITSHNTSANAHSTLFNSKANVNHTHNGNDVSYSTSTVYNDGTVGKAISGKQDTLTAGQNITIENNVISATGGESKNILLEFTVNGSTVTCKEYTSQQDILISQLYAQSKLGYTIEGFAKRTVADTPFNRDSVVVYRCIQVFKQEDTFRIILESDVDRIYGANEYGDTTNSWHLGKTLLNPSYTSSDNGKVLTIDSNNKLSWQTASGGAVNSVNGQTGDVVLDADDIAYDTNNSVEDVLTTHSQEIVNLERSTTISALSLDYEHGSIQTDGVNEEIMRNYRIRSRTKFKFESNTVGYLEAGFRAYVFVYASLTSITCESTSGDWITTNYTFLPTKYYRVVIARTSQTEDPSEVANIDVFMTKFIYNNDKTISERLDYETSNIKNAINYIPVTFDCERGSLDASGNNIVADYRIRTTSRIKFSKNTAAIIDDNFLVYIFEFASASSPTCEAYYNWFNGVFVFSSAKYYRYVIKRKNESQSEIANPLEFLTKITYESEEQVSVRVGDNKNKISKLYKYSVAQTDEFLKLICHRGYNIIAPENTIPAFILAKQNGFKFVETDVRFTSDNIPVLLHDASINITARNADGSVIPNTINIADITYTQALNYDFGIWKSSEYAGTKIPTFDEFLVVCKNIGLDAYVELKTGLTSEQASLLVSKVKLNGMKEHITFISFSEVSLTAIKTIDNTFNLGLLHTTQTSAVIDIITSLRTTNTVYSLPYINGSLDTTFRNLCVSNNIPIEYCLADNLTSVLALDKYVTGIITDCYNSHIGLYDYLTQ